jgi:ribosomal protein S25
MSQRQRGQGFEKQIRGINFPDIGDQELRRAISEMKAITPYSVSNQFNIRVSVAKRLLEELLQKGVIEQVDGNSRIKVFQVRDQGE